MSRANAKRKDHPKPECEVWDLYPERSKIDVTSPKVSSMVLQLLGIYPGLAYAALLKRAIASIEKQRRLEMLAHGRRAKKALAAGQPPVRVVTFQGALLTR